MRILNDSVEVFHFDGERYSADDFWMTHDGEPMPAGWYYWVCLPGCMPDSEPFGPYDSPEEAEASARDLFDDPA